MNSESVQLAVIGGGINGAGAAQAAAAAGYTTLVLEKNSQAGLETSSRSSKLIHGGLRYLETFEFGLVRESLKERELLIKLAPELVRMQQFNIPLYKSTRRSALALHAGLSLYALLAGLRYHHRYKKIKPSHWSQLEGLSTEGLQHVFQYQDAQTDDAALTRAVMASAQQLGAETAYGASLVAGQVHANHVDIEYTQNGQTKHLRCDALINATGPWVETTNQKIQPHKAIAKPELVQGAHLVLKQAVHQAYYLEAAQDGRVVFLLPWKNGALLGTTEHVYTGDPAKVHTLDEERRYLLDVYAHYFPDRDKTIIGDMAGCRVLPGIPQGENNNLFKRSRETVFEQNQADQPRVISIVGGKLTVYRQTAHEALQKLEGSLPKVKTIADTSRLAIHPV